MSVTAAEKSPVLIVTVGGRACAIALHHVAETMRPLPIEAVSGTPAFVRGVSVIRGSPIPVVDMRALLGSSEHGPNRADYGRFVTLKLGERRVAVGVDAVVGLSDLDPARLSALPPLLQDVAADVIDAIGTRDAQLLVVLRAARIVPDEVWASVAAAGATR